MAAPSGVLETEDSNKMSHCTWVYTRVNMSKPVLCLPTKDKYTSAVRFSPQFFKLRPVKTGLKQQQTPSEPDKPWLAARSLFALPYRMVYAVATQNAIMFYDTQQVAPFGRVSNVHYAGLTDLAWSPCGSILFASSSDGYCSIVSFAPGEIGEKYIDEKTSSDSVKASNVKDASTEIKINAKPRPDNDQKSTTKENKSNAKRLQFITLSSPKANKKVSKSNQVETKKSEKMELNLNCEEDSLGVEIMDTDDNDELKLVLEETEPEPFKKAAVTAAQATTSAATAPTTSQPLREAPGQVVDGKKRVPLTALMTGPNTGPGAGTVAAATPEKGKGRRVNLITLSSPKTKT